MLINYLLNGGVQRKGNAKLISEYDEIGCVDR